MPGNIFRRCLLILLFIPPISSFGGDEGLFSIARLKYQGGGDWYVDPTDQENLLKFVSEHTSIRVSPGYHYVDLSTGDLSLYPFLFMTGHGNLNFSAEDALKLRKYLESGGFLYVDDDYGLNEAFRREIKKVFPDNDLRELPFSYGLYHCFYDFPAGPPKTHQHDGKPPQGFGIFLGKRLALYYTYESNPSDGWVDAEVFNDPPQKRLEALQFGTNLVVWALSN